jgi:hypothetical protein
MELFPTAGLMGYLIRSPNASSLILYLFLRCFDGFLEYSLSAISASRGLLKFSTLNDVIVNLAFRLLPFPCSLVNPKDNWLAIEQTSTYMYTGLPIQCL